MKWRLVSVVLGVVVVVGSVALFAQPLARWLETPRPLSKIAGLVHDAHHDPKKQAEAERELALFLRYRPDSREANILMAKLLIDRNNPRPQKAIEHLDRVRSRDAKTRSAVLVSRGKALYVMSRLREAEADWLEAMKLNPEVPEAGWLLIQQYYLQGRNDEGHALALRLGPLETDPVDRVRYILELVREDVERLAPAGIIPWLEPAVKNDPRDWASVLALGRALVKEGRGTEGLALIQRVLAVQSEDAKVWEVLLNALNDEGNLEELGRQLEKLPRSIAEDRRFAFFRGRLAQERQALEEAARAYRTYLEVRPHDPKVLYRLARVLRISGHPDEAKVYEQREAEVLAASKDLKALYDQVKAEKKAPDISVFQKFAAIRERQGETAEAIAWHRLVLNDDPENVESRVAVARLQAHDRVSPGAAASSM